MIHDCTLSANCFPKLDLRQGGSSSTQFTDIEPRLQRFQGLYLSVPFVALLKAPHAETCLRFCLNVNLWCVLIVVFLNASSPLCFRFFLKL